MAHQGIIHQLLTEAGDGTGTNNFIGDYSVTPAYPLITVPAGKTSLELHHLTMFIEDTGNYDGSTFGFLTALTNGIGMDIVSGTTSHFDMTLGSPVKTNGNATRVSTTVQEFRGKGSGTSSLSFHWDFDDTMGFPLILCGRNDHGVRITLNDNMAGLESLQFTASGHYRENCVVHTSE